MQITPTSLKLPKALKTRISRLARQTGESPHALMLRLLEEQVRAAEQFEAFVADARRADEGMTKSGVGYAAADVHDFLAARTSGRRAIRPKPAQWRR